MRTSSIHTLATRRCGSILTSLNTGDTLFPTCYSYRKCIDIKRDISRRRDRIVNAKWICRNTCQLSVSYPMIVIPLSINIMNEGGELPLYACWCAYFPNLLLQILNYSPCYIPLLSIEITIIFVSEFFIIWISILLYMGMYRYIILMRLIK